MIICLKCKKAIESKEGSITVESFETCEETITCEWCEETVSIDNAVNWVSNKK
jgi:hypothetical protein